MVTGSGSFLAGKLSWLQGLSCMLSGVTLVSTQFCGSDSPGISRPAGTVFSTLCKIFFFSQQTPAIFLVCNPFKFVLFI